jgi:hypothetical protein
MKQAKPTNAAGVSVHLTATDPNGNFQDIGTATSNAMGNYAYAWTPPVPGVYSVTASFDGSKSYYGSQAGTAFLVSEATATPVVNPTVPPATQTIAPTSAPTNAPTATVAPTPSPVIIPPTNASPTTTYIGIAVAVIVIVAVAAALVLRRRK